jgi:hypothetical protein
MAEVSDDACQSFLERTKYWNFIRDLRLKEILVLND